jgi:hypothetical protein
MRELNFGLRFAFSIFALLAIPDFLFELRRHRVLGHDEVHPRGCLPSGLRIRYVAGAVSTRSGIPSSRKRTRASSSFSAVVTTEIFIP